MCEFTGGKLLGKKGQYIAFITLVMIFVFISVIATFTDSISRALSVDEDSFQLVQRENNRLGNTILQTGYPVNWDESNVERIGFLSDSRLNMSKVNNASSISDSNYNDLKSLLGANYDVHISVGDGQGGFTEIGVKDSDARIIVTSNRQVILLDGTTANIIIESSSS